MGEQITFEVNDFNHEIAALLEKLRGFESVVCEPRVKALMITKLEEAQLWSLVLIRKVSQ